MMSSFAGLISVKRIKKASDHHDKGIGNFGCGPGASRRVDVVGLSSATRVPSSLSSDDNRVGHQPY